jgi:photosystem II stability/assembly factor-like uncharacterized protein
MQRLNAIITGVVFVIASAMTSMAQEIWVGKDGNIRGIETRAIVVDQGGLYLATPNEIYHAKDIKDKWQSVFSLPAGENEIICLGARSRNILAGTKRGLFRSQDGGGAWKNVFRTIMPEKNNIKCIEISRYNWRKVMIGTGRGIFYSEDFGDRWLDISGPLKGRCVNAIAMNKDSTYASADSGLYFRKDAKSAWVRIFVQGMAKDESGDDIQEEEQYTEGVSGSDISCLMLKNNRIYAGLGKRIIFSDDNGKTWAGFSCEGLSGLISALAASDKDNRMYCATTKGVFEFNDARWMELYKGADRQFSVNGIVASYENGGLWALTDKGLYRLESGRYASDEYIDVERNLKSLKVIFDNEPYYSELQKAAMRFAEVDPEKIRRMRSEARLKALLPKVSFGVDKSRSTNSEIYTSATKDYVVMGPDDEDNGFDISISWELADFIWSDDQTNIDVRSKLTTQLRNDILDDLRRAYYERKRLQFELITAPPKDMKIRFDKEMRVRELGQAIDDLTGNYLSEHTVVTGEEKK